MTATERKSDFQITTDTPYSVLMGELWGVYSEDLEDNWPCYNGTTLHLFFKSSWSQYIIQPLMHIFYRGN